jgi:hypothetical protein
MVMACLPLARLLDAVTAPASCPDSSISRPVAFLPPAGSTGREGFSSSCRSCALHRTNHPHLGISPVSGARRSCGAFCRLTRRRNQHGLPPVPTPIDVTDCDDELAALRRQLDKSSPKSTRHCSGSIPTHSEPAAIALARSPQPGSRSFLMRTPAWPATPKGHHDPTDLQEARSS